RSSGTGQQTLRVPPHGLHRWHTSNARPAYSSSTPVEGTMRSTGSPDARLSSSSPAGGKQPSETKPKSSVQPTSPPRRTWLWFLCVLVGNFLLVKLVMPGQEDPVTVPYTLFKEEGTKGNRQPIYSRADVITGKFKPPAMSPPPSEKRAAAGGSPQATSER